MKRRPSSFDRCVSCNPSTSPESNVPLNGLRRVIRHRSRPKRPIEPETLAVVGPTGTLPEVVAPAVAAIALFLLAASGVAKLIDPDPTTGAMRAAGLPASNLVSYLLGLAEIGVATWALGFAGMGVILATMLYGAFSVFTIAAVKRRIPVQSCGCFGREDTPPSLLHVAFNLAAAAGLLASALLGLSPIDWAMPPFEVALYVGFGLLGAYASFLVLSRLPQLFALVRTT
jgi:hypothetical protein